MKRRYCGRLKDVLGEADFDVREDRRDRFVDTSEVDEDGRNTHVNLRDHSAAEGMAWSRAARQVDARVDSILERLDAEEAQARGRKD